MPIEKQDQDIGKVTIKSAGELINLGIRGLATPQLIVDAMREIPQHEDLRHFSERQIEAVIKAFKVGWGEIDRYLLAGGVISSTGLEAFFREFRDSRVGDLGRGFWLTRALYYSSRSSFDRPFTFDTVNSLAIAAPGLGEKLKAVRAAKGVVGRDFEHHLHLPGEILDRGFVPAAVGGWGKRIEALASEPTAGMKVPFKKVAEARFYDHARRQVIPLDQM